jgi:uncharacterized protein
MIKVEKPSVEKLEEIKQWKIWEKDPTKFNHHYNESEYFYFLQGKAEISDQHGNTTQVNSGDLVTIEKGADTTWTIHETVRKHFLFF